MCVSPQVHQERTYQDYVVTKSREKVTQLEYYYEQIITQTHTEINSIHTWTRFYNWIALFTY